MLDEIVLKIVLTIVGTLITGSCGFLSAKVVSYKKKTKEKEANEQIQNVALQTLLKSQLTNTYFVYNELKEIPDYVYQNFLDMLKVYESLGGNSYIHTIARKMEQWEITKTDIL